MRTGSSGKDGSLWPQRSISSSCLALACCSPSTVKNGTCMPKVPRVLTAGTCVSLFFLSLPLEVAIRFFCKMATALLRSSIARLAASSFCWLSDAFFEISFWRKSTLLCRQLVLRTMLFSIVQTSIPGTSCAYAVLVASAMPTARTRDFSIIIPARSRDAATPPEARGLERLR
jgi:hypothetical protein